MFGTRVYFENKLELRNHNIINNEDGNITPNQQNMKIFFTTNNVHFKYLTLVFVLTRLELKLKTTLHVFNYKYVIRVCKFSKSRIYKEAKLYNIRQRTHFNNIILIYKTLL